MKKSNFEKVERLSKIKNVILTTLKYILLSA